jgi:hypothetical protein
LAAARLRSRWVLSDGCPVVKVHFSFGFALQTGHGTDKIRLCVSGLVCTFLVFSIVNPRNGQFCSLGERMQRTRNQAADFRITLM